MKKVDFWPLGGRNKKIICSKSLKDSARLYFRPGERSLLRPFFEISKVEEQFQSKQSGPVEVTFGSKQTIGSILLKKTIFITRCRARLAFRSLGVGCPVLSNLFFFGKYFSQHFGQICMFGQKSKFCSLIKMKMSIKNLLHNKNINQTFTMEGRKSRFDFFWPFCQIDIFYFAQRNTLTSSPFNLKSNFWRRSK